MAKLTVVPTPVGNLEDMTFRAIRVLKEADLILAEDTRTTGILLKHFEIQNKMQSHHKFNEHKTVEQIAARIKGGENIALVSDAGTPAISDPGFMLVRECVRQGVDVECLPGATAFVPALVASGLPNEKFCFEGFLPQKKGRQTRLKELALEYRTIIFYESPFRLLKTLTQFAEFFGTDRQVSVSREISKLHEETVRGSLEEVIQHFTVNEPRGEIVIVLAGLKDKRTKRQKKMFNLTSKKNMKKVLLVCVCTAMLASCGQNSADYKKLKAENDSLRIENTKNTDELNDMLSTLNDIESDFQSIRDAENYLTIQQQTGGELNQSRRDQIKQNMQLISETLKKNKEQISQLEEKLKKSGIQSSALRKTIDRLSSELDQKATMIVALQEDLAKKNVRIQELDEMVSSLNEDVESLATTAAAQSEKLNAQDKALHTAYYCFGTSKELKEQKILSGGGLFSKSKVLQSGFNKDYFISIDIREVKEIPLFASKAKLKSNHPEGSYEFVEDEDGNLTLKINDEKAFWSLGKYLVIEVG